MPPVSETGYIPFNGVSSFAFADAGRAGVQQAAAPLAGAEASEAAEDYRVEPKNDASYMKSPIEKALDKVRKGQTETLCRTCEERRYVDQSDDSSVSFQSPTKIKANVHGVVASHEREHVFAERARARQEGREVLSQTVSIRYCCCEECGKRYVSGGVTRTVTKKQAESAYEQFTPLE